MNNPALETLFYGLEQSDAELDGRILFVNAQAHAELPGGIKCVQWFKPYADALNGFNCEQRIEDVSGEFDTALLLFPKNVIEGAYLLANAFRYVARGGSIFISAENKAGGNRVQKIVQQFGAEIVQQISKNKSRFLEIKNTGVNADAVDVAIKAGGMQNIEKTGFIAQSGVYGWGKIDKGSKILLQHIPQDIKGKIADFGCGYGYLLQHILQQNNTIKTAYAIDADARAVDATRLNMGDDERVEYLWADLTQSQNIPNRLDTIIMNPPFHEGKKADSDIGVSFIKTAAQTLKRNGVLYMVANTQLPYEAALEDDFFSHELLAQEGGFKVFKAVR